MSFDYVRSITIKGGQVYITAAASNISPRTYHQDVSEYHSKLYRESGLHALLKDIAADVHNGNYRLGNGSLIARRLSEANDHLIRHKHLKNFLDSEHASKFMADYASMMLQNPRCDPSEFLREEFQTLNALRSDKAAVLQICKSNPAAFDLADPAISTDRECAKEFIQNCAGNIRFNFPQAFLDDKDLAILALNQDGCIFRQLPLSLREDKDIVQLAFDQEKSRTYFEHLPDLISPSLRKNVSFMRELVQSCPSLHIHRAKDILDDFETMKIWAEKGKWVIHDLYCAPKKYLNSPEIHDILLNRFNSPEDIEYLQRKYKELGLKAPKPQKKSLSQQISAAANRGNEKQSESRAHGRGGEGEVTNESKHDGR